MTEVVQASTQTLEFGPFPSSINLTEANIYFSVSQFGRTIFEKSNPSVYYMGQIVYVNLSQVDTLQLSEGDAKVQLNITMNNGGTRLPTYEAPIKVLHNQIQRVLP